MIRATVRPAICNTGDWRNGDWGNGDTSRYGNFIQYTTNIPVPMYEYKYLYAYYDE
jgi:hypothetical protein